MKKTPTSTVPASGAAACSARKRSDGVPPGRSCEPGSLIIDPLSPTTETPTMTVTRAAHLGVHKARPRQSEGRGRLVEPQTPAKEYHREHTDEEDQSAPGHLIDAHRRVQKTDVHQLEDKALAGCDG